MAEDIRSQDERFSQFYAMPMHINPAMTGAYEGTYRLTAVYRDQWYNSLGSSFKTMAAGGDTRFQPTFGGRQLKDHLGLGLFFVSDRITIYQATTNKLSGYLSYHKKLGNRIPSYLAGGIQFGVIQRNINYDNLTFGDQFNQLDAYDRPTSESLPPNNLGVFNFSLGVSYYIQMEKNKYYIGVAAHNLGNPNISFFSRQDNLNPSTIIDQTLPTRYTVHLSMDMNLKYGMELQPRFIYQKQAQDNLLSLGTNVEYTFQQKEFALIGGLWVNIINDLDGTRMSHITPLVGVKKGAFTFGFSYDWGLQDVSNNPFHLNSFEFSIRFSGDYFNEDGFCPSF